MFCVLGPLSSSIFDMLDVCGINRVSFAFPQAQSVAKETGEDCLTLLFCGLNFALWKWAHILYFSHGFGALHYS